MVITVLKVTTMWFSCLFTSNLVPIYTVSGLALLLFRSRSTTSSSTASPCFSALTLALFSLLVSASVWRVIHHVTSVTSVQTPTSAIALAKLSLY